MASLVTCRDEKPGINPAGGRTTCPHLLSMRTHALGHTESYQYDQNGNLTQFTDRRGGGDPPWRVGEGLAGGFIPRLRDYSCCSPAGSARGRASWFPLGEPRACLNVVNGSHLHCRLRVLKWPLV